MAAKRSSSRTTVLSKAMRYVDEDTRREVRDKRIAALENDNYLEVETADNEDDAYGESDDEGGKKRKRSSKSKGAGPKSKWATRAVKPLERVLLDNGIAPPHRREKANIGVGGGGRKSSRAASSAATVALSGTADLPDEVEYDSDGFEILPGSSRGRSQGTQDVGEMEVEEEEGEPDYYSIAARPSVNPARNVFCSVCGYKASYRCTRCGSRFCSIRCNENHKETRCMKFSM
ncbi:hypothetical protein B484DRAFT_457575 [Ochromonadaceae sp. CCMP2298]|nr:hypothetical protein B484DRAFT_457575 [Ochromonadaceae sp. CCMP2298]|mmetsp:Transcript_7388/g.16197  ORF Transcript_7388/g.16197 Transcript_7388/m.16197 type:complete len:232 (-) Transcript_7388:70-765(-)